jgi:hypothetical protein
MVRDAAARLLTMRISEYSDLILRSIASAMRLEGWTQELPFPRRVAPELS